ncbi:MAG: hypothetical protein K8S87_02685 [Planctomycetes bacterium]|nr:hypothetical protein [Planctomycetota bacterium]
MRPALILFMLSLLLFFISCERDADVPIVEETPHEMKVENIDSKINLIIESYLSAGKKQNYDDLLIEKASEIEQHGNIAKNILLKRIGTEPKKDLLLVEAYFQIVGVSKDSLLHATALRNNVLTHHAALRYRCEFENEYVYGEKYLEILSDSLDDESIFCSKSKPMGTPVWLFAANEIKKLVNIDFGLDISSELSATMQERVKILRNWMKISIPYYYSKEYEQPTTLKEYRTYHLDIEAMNANIPTREFRRMEEHKWLSPNNHDGYGSPFYAPSCFENWALFKNQFSTYSIDSFQLREFEQHRKK